MSQQLVSRLLPQCSRSQGDLSNLVEGVSVSCNHEVISSAPQPVLTTLSPHNATSECHIYLLIQYYRISKLSVSKQIMLLSRGLLESVLVVRQLILQRGLCGTPVKPTLSLPAYPFLVGVIRTGVVT